MAIRYAVANGVWSATSTWNGGTLPTSADDVYSNTFTVTIDTSPTVLSISYAATTGVNVGGTFIPTNGITLTLTGGGVLCSTGSGGTTFNSTLSIGQACSIIGNCVAGSTNANAVANNGAGTINITGNVTGGTGGGSDFGVRNTSTGIVNITGNVTSGSAQAGAQNSSTGILNITGTCTGGISAAAFASASAGTLVHTGNVIAANNVSAIVSTNTGATVILSGPFITSSNGTNPVYSPRWFWLDTPAPTYYQIRTANLATIRPLYTADSVGGNPSVSNVRSGTIFGPSSELTGTVAVPPANSVLTGVPVDNTVGSGTMDPTQFWNHPISGLTTSGSIGERLKTAATVNVMGQLISDSFSAR